MIKYVKNHLAIKVFLLTMFILMALGGLVYSLILFSIPKSYLSELADSAHHQIVQAIPNLEKMTLEEGQVFLNRFSQKTGLSLYLTDYLGNEIASFGDTGYYAVGNGNGSSNTIIFQTYSLDFSRSRCCSDCGVVAVRALYYSPCARNRRAFKKDVRFGFFKAM